MYSQSKLTEWTWVLENVALLQHSNYASANSELIKAKNVSAAKLKITLNDVQVKKGPKYQTIIQVHFFSSFQASLGLVGFRFPCQCPAFGQQGKPWVSTRFRSRLSCQIDLNHMEVNQTGDTRNKSHRPNRHNVKIDSINYWHQASTVATLCEETATTPRNSWQ